MYMKKLLLIIIAMAISTTIHGQQIDQPTNRYRGNDVLEKKQVIVNGFSLGNTKGVWNLEKVKLSEETYNAEYTTGTDTLMAECTLGPNPVVQKNQIQHR